MGGAAKTVGRVGSGVLTLGGSEIARNNLGPNNIISKALQTPGMIMTGGMSGGYGPAQGSNYTDPNAGALNLYMDPAGDSAAINNLGQSQFDQSNQLLGKNVGLINDEGQNQFGQTSGQITQDNTQRAAARDQLATLLQEQVAQTFKQTLPGTAEDYNAGGLLNSTGYQQEVARQQANLAAQVTNQLGQQGVQDMYTTTNQRDAALQALQGFQNQGLNQQVTGSQANLAGLQGANQQALGRVFNLQDYAREANVAKQIGAQIAPSTKPSKGSSAAGALGGIGSGASAGSLMGGPHGAVAGGIGGGLLGILGANGGGK